jgi:hypothetical protein
MKTIKQFFKSNGRKVEYRNDKFVKTGFAMTDCLKEYNNGVKLEIGGQKFNIA